MKQLDSVVYPQWDEKGEPQIFDNYGEPVEEPRERLPGCRCEVPCLGFTCGSGAHSGPRATPWCRGGDRMPAARPKTDAPVDTEHADALAAAAGAWAILRKGRRNALPRVRRFKGTPQRQEKSARAAWKRLDVREGWAAPVDADGKTIARQSGPWGVRTVW